ncbi:MAG: Rrf2 family transcriptional regulator [Candidatus Muiribacterium halophilum]|uniref:Rrf2 family transcriptional regulator n=1 Tax=Muiribacterium halophilum TaxID=2053465 RepID=A0A2N5ZDS8_MUIH1|nr:MAG: Rrf2 family transcriptional regulator [Candidatus Muirbacterium halophilum]
MKLTTKSEYSLLACIYIARYFNKKMISSLEISEHYNISKKYIETLLTTLKQRNILISKAGKNGGYSLAREPKDIFLSEIVRTMDGALSPLASASENFYEPGPLENEPGLNDFFREIRDYIAKRMESTSLADFM